MFKDAKKHIMNSEEWIQCIVASVTSNMLHEDTSDATYGNHAESMVFNLSGQDMDKFKCCGKLFDDMMGITAPRIPAKPSAAAPTVSCTPSPRIMIPKAAHTTLPQRPDTNFEHLRSFDFSGESDGCADEVVVEIVNSRQAHHSAITPPMVSPIPPPHRKSVSPIPENSFNDAAWEEVVPIAPPPRPHHTPLPSRPTAAPVAQRHMSQCGL